MIMPAVVNQRLLPLAGKRPGELLVHEIYRSIQGESAYAGLPCVFVRLAVCDSRCVWCDTPHAFAAGESRSLSRIVQEVLAFSCPLVEVTGGEPLLQSEVFTLMTTFCHLGLKVLLETSGAHAIDQVDRRVHIVMDLKCPASGEAERNRWENLAALKATDEIKFVVASREDFNWAIERIRDHRLDQRFGLLMGPVFGAVEPRDLADWLLTSGINARMQLQLHKYIWDPKARGV
jgi:7-carboxy-7-deazaguanine synthase